MDFLMVIMASRVARGRLRTTNGAAQDNDYMHIPANRLKETCSLGF